MTKTELTELAVRIGKISGVQSANAWTKVAGKARIYVDLTKHNGGKSWNRGRGAAIVIHADGAVADPVDWAGAATRDYHSDHGTIAAIRAAVEASAAPEPTMRAEIDDRLAELRDQITARDSVE